MGVTLLLYRFTHPAVIHYLLVHVSMEKQEEPCKVDLPQSTQNCVINADCSRRSPSSIFFRIRALRYKLLEQAFHHGVISLDIVFHRHEADSILSH